MIHLDSRNRTNQHDHNGQPVWQLKRPIACSTIRLLSAQIPHSFLTVSDDMPDNGLQFQVGATPLNVVLDPQHYTGTSLAAAIQSKVRALSGGAFAAFTCTFSQDTLRLTFGYTALYTVIATDRRMASLTGLVLNQVVFSSSTLHPPNQIELAPPCIYLVSSALGPSCISGSKTALVKPTFTIPCDQNVGSLISFSHASHFDQVLSYGDGPKNEISEIDMRITDQYGNTLNPSIPWCITMAYA